MIRSEPADDQLMLFPELRVEWVIADRGALPVLSPAAEELFRELGRLGHNEHNRSLSVAGAF